MTVPQHALLSIETIEWIGSLDQFGLSDQQNLALAMMRGSGRVTNGMLQAWGVDQSSATQALRDLVARGVAVISGGKRYASYQLAAPLATTAATRDAPTGMAGIDVELDSIIQAIQAGHTTSQALSDRLGIEYQTLMRRIKVLRDRGQVEALRPSTSSRQSYRVI